MGMVFGVKLVEKGGIFFPVRCGGVDFNVRREWLTSL